MAGPFAEPYDARWCHRALDAERYERRCYGTRRLLAITEELGPWARYRRSMRAR
jgi:hypothetical protein